MSIKELVNSGQDIEPSPFISHDAIVGWEGSQAIHAVVVGRVLTGINLTEENGQYDLEAEYETYIPDLGPFHATSRPNFSPHSGIDGKKERIITAKTSINHAKTLQFSASRLDPETAQFLSDFMGDLLDTPNPHIDPPPGQLQPLQLQAFREISLNAA